MTIPLLVIPSVYLTASRLLGPLGTFDLRYTMGPDLGPRVLSTITFVTTLGYVGSQTDYHLWS